jgi:hypothetical protein
LVLTGLGFSAGPQNSIKQQTCESTGLAVSCCLSNTGSSFYETHNGEPDTVLSSVSVFMYYKVSHWSFKFAIP